MRQRGAEPVWQNVASLAKLDEGAQKQLLFDSIVADNLVAVQNLLRANASLLTTPLHGHFGRDAVRDRPCYKYTGQKKQGYFYPLHAAADAGSKAICVLMLKTLKESGGEGQGHGDIDSLGQTAEQRATGHARDAFYEVLYGMSYAEAERYVGAYKKGRDGQEQRHGQGELFFKPVGYNSKQLPKDVKIDGLVDEVPLYRGGFKDGCYHGIGTLWWRHEDSPKSSTLTSVGSASSISVGSTVTGKGIAPNTIVTSVDPVANTVTINTVVTAEASADEDTMVTFTHPLARARTANAIPNVITCMASLPTTVATVNPPNWRALGVKKYHGRFRDGKLHGHGIEYDKDGNKMYKGAFRHGMRHGWGCTYERIVDVTREKAVRTYKGQWKDGKMHGFGIRYEHHDGLCHVFVGTFCNNVKTGVGVFYNAVDHSRFEGMFSEDEPHGPGSLYKLDPVTDQYVVGEHMSMSRENGVMTKTVLNTPFVPDREYIPDDHAHKIATAANLLDDFEYLFDNGVDATAAAAAAVVAAEGDHAATMAHIENNPAETSEAFTARARRRASIVHHAHHYVGNWKAALGRHLKLSREDAELMDMVYEDEDEEGAGNSEGRGEAGGGGGMGGGWRETSEGGDRKKGRRRSTKEFELRRSSDVHGEVRLDGSDEDDGGEGEGEEEEDGYFSASINGDDLDSDSDSDFGDGDADLGSRWREFPPLNVAYIYVKTIERVFEVRAMQSSDFEAVHDLVIDAIDSFESRFKEAVVKAVAGNDEGEKAEQQPRNKRFDNERQRRESIAKRQKAELAAQKASAELQPQVERSLGRAVMEELRNQLRILAPPTLHSKQQQQQQHNHHHHHHLAIGGGRGGAARPRSTPLPQQQPSQHHHEGSNEFAEELLHLVDKALLLLVV